MYVNKKNKFFYRTGHKPCWIGALLDWAPIYIIGAQLGRIGAQTYPVQSSPTQSTFNILNSKFSLNSKFNMLNKGPVGQGTDTQPYDKSWSPQHLDRFIILSNRVV